MIFFLIFCSAVNSSRAATATNFSIGFFSSVNHHFSSHCNIDKESLFIIHRLFGQMNWKFEFQFSYFP